MTIFAKVNNGVVETVIVAESSFFDTFVDSSPGTWIETSKDIRKNYAGIGYTYDEVRNAFIPPRIFDSWTLDEGTCQWIPPIPYPEDGRKYIWDEVTQWDVVS
jgi:hypothetical protein